VTGPPAGTAPCPRVSVIIPHLNTPDALDKCLASVTSQALADGEAEIIVVDNGSTVSIAAVQARYPMVRFLAEPVPGPGPARNHGIGAARSVVLAFIDADCRAAPGWLQTAVDAVTAAPGRAVVGGDIRIDFADPARLTPIEAYEAVFGFRQQMYIETKRFSVTANLAMDRAVHAAVGPFAGIDKAEDLDWGRRAHALGYATRYVPAMRVYHPARPDFVALERKWQRHIRHDWNDHGKSGAAAWGWRLRAVAMLASIPVETIKLFRSDRIAGLRNRGVGVSMLVRIRWFRCTEMLRVMGASGEGGGDFWNRSN
jgi:glycosyltransferase involved in cell wall biosynthesis